VVGVYSVFMLVYAALMLRKFTLSLVGVGIILAALFSSTATMFYLNMQSSQLTYEVTPYLLLLLGIDNIFLISKTEK